MTSIRKNVSPAYAVGLMGLALLPLIASSCATFAPSTRDVGELGVPESYTLYEHTAPAPGHWWEAFQSDELNRLVAATLEDNLSLQQAYARLEQAGALARQAQAVRYPTLSYSASGSVSRSRVDTGASVSGMDAAAEKLEATNTLLTAANSALGATTLAGATQSARSGLQALETLTNGAGDEASTSTNKTYQLGLVSSYEVDLWGRLRANVRSAQMEYEASIEDTYTSMQSLAAQVVLAWLDLLYYQQTLDVVNAQLETNQKVLDLLELRHLKRLSTSLDVLQQRQALAETKAAIPPLEANVQLLYHEIALLTGQPPRTEIDVKDITYPVLDPLPELGLPADLLANRPDVRSAGLLLTASDWSVSAARADRLPGMQLSGSAGFGPSELDLLFNNWIATLAASITGPIFDAGKRKAEVDRTRAVVQERLAAYRETVYTAVKEVEDALVQEAKQETYLAALNEQIALAESYYSEASSRYQKGLDDYLPVLGALTNLQSLQRAEIAARHDLLAYRVALHRALGGRWTTDFLSTSEV